MATQIPENTATFGLDEVARVTAAERIDLFGTRFDLRGVATDSRSDLRGKLFVALSGERFDGHDYCEQAARQGAAALLVERAVATRLPQLLVPSTLRALGALAAAYRRRFATKVVGIAGAAGKTTTRALTQSLLVEVLSDRVLATPGNLNNLIGVPMVLFGLDARHQAAVVEIGTNQPGEVGALTAMARPNIALLTLIALEHTEGLGDLDGVEEEEACIYAHGPVVAIGNGDDPRVRRQLERSAAGTRLCFGMANDAEYRLNTVELMPNGRTALSYRTPTSEVAFETEWLPRTVALSLMAAQAAAESVLGRALHREDVESALARGDFRQPGRLELLRLANGAWVLDDSYNSNPASLTAALEMAQHLASKRAAKLHAVLGEMRELGRLSETEHRQVGQSLKDVRLASLTAVSGDALYFLEPGAAPTSQPEGFFETSSAAVERVVAKVRPGDVVLVKGSRGTRTEVVVRALCEAGGGRLR